MQFDTVHSETDGRGVCTVWLNRPDKHNAMSEQMITELSALSTDLRESAVRVVVLVACGPSFCAGGDLKWMQAQMRRWRQTRAAAAGALAMMLQAWNTLPQPGDWPNSRECLRRWCWIGVNL